MVLPQYWQLAQVLATTEVPEHVLPLRVPPLGQEYPLKYEQDVPAGLPEYDPAHPLVDTKHFPATAVPDEHTSYTTYVQYVPEPG